MDITGIIKKQCCGRKEIIQEGLVPFVTYQCGEAVVDVIKLGRLLA